jgi:hypothetical protein
VCNSGSGQCEDCGYPGMQCCSGNTCPDPYGVCDPGSGYCQYCGYSGNPCCSGGTCLQGTCAAGTCG